MNRKCAQCGEVYEQGNQRQGKRFCSMQCQRDSQAERRAAHLRTCAWCNKEFTPRNPGTMGTGKFCSQNCWRLKRQFHEPPRKVGLPCTSCGRLVVRSVKQRAGNAGIYCSRDCQATGRMREGSESSRGKGWTALRRQIRERDGHACVRCGGDDGSRQLAVDHIIPWVMVKHRPEIGNDPSNLASLCLRCHGIKTTVTEPRLMVGDFVALEEFYGRTIKEQAMTTLAALDD